MFSLTVHLSFVRLPAFVSLQIYILTGVFIILPFLIAREAKAVFRILPATWAGKLKNISQRVLGLKFVMNIGLKGVPNY